MKSNLLFTLILLLVFSLSVDAQRRGKADKEKADMEMKQDDSPMKSSTFNALKFRNIGPAFCSGRISDIAMHPQDDNIWYVAVGSGGVWKTANAGTTWKPIFDKYNSYSTGCITIDPNNPHTIWLGTGENVGGRHVGFGDGIYKSTDDGNSWKNMGLKESEHLSKIVVHPENSEIVWVAAQGPLWSTGGERGLYKTEDGGENWKKVLGDDEWVGVTDVVINPEDPNWIYAATWQRHRTIAAYMGGGPGSGLHRSNDGGETWQKLTKGIPGSNLGKIGLAISPHNPDILYAAIELDRVKGGVYMSMDRGISWKKQSDAVSGATGPHYYQELYACPHHAGRLYLMDVRVQVSDDHGKTFRRLKEEDKHSDNHAIAFRKDDPDYLLIGTDAGIYESFDLAENWRFIENLPLTQYYKVAVDDAIPFYFVYGGTQDNGSHGGPSRTSHSEGITNADWFKTLGADGHQSATEPGNPNIMYAESQQGGLHRVDRITGEQVYIQPQSREGEGFERFNWDAPILVSPHDPTRLYFASYRVWRSDNRGDAWTPISGDLTKNQERLTLPIMGKVQSWDNAWDVNAMSNYNTITSLAESPLQEGLIYAGTDDGIIQVTEDGGQNWRKIELANVPDVPATAFVNDVKADLFDVNTVYISLDNHKYGDFRPYLIKSSDRGKTWKSLVSDLPERTLVWRLVQDYVDEDLLFLATEYGIYFTHNGGDNWIQLKGGLPTIPFRDLTIQRRENDLVGASFGRGFYILDDFSALRNISEETLASEATLFPIKDALWYQPKNIGTTYGAAAYAAPNPEFGATFTYYLAEGTSTLKAERKKKEKELAKEDEDIPFPGWEALEAENRQEKPQIVFVIKDDAGNIVNRVQGKTSKGMHRTSWNLRHASQSAITLGRAPGGNFFSRGGFLATPGTYHVAMYKLVDGQMTQLSDSRSFELKPLYQGALAGASYEEMIAFREKLEKFQQDITATSTVMRKGLDKVDAMQRATSSLRSESKDMVAKIYDAKMKLMDLDEMLNGNDTKDEIGERYPPTPRNRMFVGFRALFTTYGPTEMHKESVEIGVDQLSKIKNKLSGIMDDVLPSLEKALINAGAPWIEGQGLISNE